MDHGFVILFCRNYKRKMYVFGLAKLDIYPRYVTTRCWEFIHIPIKRFITFLLINPITFAVMCSFLNKGCLIVSCCSLCTPKVYKWTSRSFIVQFFTVRLYLVAWGVIPPCVIMTKTKLSSVFLPSIHTHTACRGCLIQQFSITRTILEKQ